MEWQINQQQDPPEEPEVPEPVQHFADADLREVMVHSEGRHTHVYQDNRGYDTIGVGHNLEARELDRATWLIIYPNEEHQPRNLDGTPVLDDEGNPVPTIPRRFEDTNDDGEPIDGHTQPIVRDDFRDQTRQGLTDAKINALFSYDIAYFQNVDLRPGGLILDSNDAVDVAAWNAMTAERQMIFISMTFNMGEDEIPNWNNFLTEIRREDTNWNFVAYHMMDSAWWCQVQNRSARYVAAIYLGERERLWDDSHNLPALNTTNYPVSDNDRPDRGEGRDGGDLENKCRYQVGQKVNNQWVFHPTRIATCYNCPPTVPRDFTVRYNREANENRNIPANSMTLSWSRPRHYGADTLRANDTNPNNRGGNLY